MRTWLAVGVALAVGVTPVWARGHGGGGHSGRSHGGSHGGTSHSGGHASSHSGSSGGHASGATHEHARAGHSPAAAVPQPLTDAERRHPRPGTGTGDRFFDGFGGRFYGRPYLSLGFLYGGGYYAPHFYGRGYGYYGGYGYDAYGYEGYGYDGVAPDAPWLYPPPGRSDDGVAPPPIGRDRDPEADRDDAEPPVLRLHVRPYDASVWVDDEFRGTGGELGGLALSAGRHRVEVLRPGYRTFTREVDIPPGRSRTLEIELEPNR